MSLLKTKARTLADAMAGAEITSAGAPAPSWVGLPMRNVRSSGARSASFAITRNTVGACCSGADHCRVGVYAGVPAA